MRARSLGRAHLTRRRHDADFLAELDVAGALQGKAIDLVKCETSDLLVPANAEMIIEGRVDFSRKIVNTLGEFAGQYGPETAPVTEITAQTPAEAAAAAAEGEKKDGGKEGGKEGGK